MLSFRFWIKIIAITLAVWLASHRAQTILEETLATGDIAGAQVIGPASTLSFEEVGSGFELPVHITHADDGSGRLYVVEQRGRIRILKNKTIQGTLLDIRDRVRAPGAGGGTEEGLLSVAFPPQYSEKGRFYVYYTNKDGDNVLSRFHLMENQSTASPSSEEQIIVFHHPIHQNHNGGQLSFGADGYLYIGTGDGGGAGDPFDNAQDPSSLLGKLLRIDVETSSPPAPSLPIVGYLPLVAKNASPGDDPANLPYRIPPDNPFINQPDYRDEIWALGLRNPWRFSFDRQTGDLYIGDVGQATWEEVNYQPSSSQGGENYGWDIMEGFECYQSVSCDKTGLTLPIHVYRTGVDGCAITGGFVYRGQANPSLKGIYIYGDYCRGTIWGLQKSGNAWVNQELASTTFFISTFGEDEDGELYLADRSSGKIYVIQSAP